MINENTKLILFGLFKADHESVTDIMTDAVSINALCHKFIDVSVDFY